MRQAGARHRLGSGSELSRLLAQLQGKARALVRPGGRVPAGADAVTGTLEDLPGALSGIHTVFLIWPFLTTEGAPAVVETIARHARRLVYLSSIGVGGDEERDDPIFRMHAGMERLIEQSGLPSAMPTA